MTTARFHRIIIAHALCLAALTGCMRVSDVDVRRTETPKIAELYTLPEEAELTLLSPRDYQVFQRSSVYSGNIAGKLKFRMDLSGDVVIAGANDRGQSVKTLQVYGEASEVEITLAGGAKKVKLGAWDGGGLNATYVTTLQVKGNRKQGLAAKMQDVDVALTGQDGRGRSLNSLRVKGPLDGVDLDLAAAAGKLRGAEWADVTVDGTYVRELRSGGAFDDVTVTLSEGVKTIKGTDWSGGGVASPYVSTFRMSGNVSDTTLNLTGQEGTTGRSSRELRARGNFDEVAVTLAFGCRALKGLNWSGGSFTGAYLGSMRIYENLSDTTITLTGQDSRGYGLKSGRIGGTYSDARMQVSHSVKKLQVGFFGAGGNLAVGVTTVGDDWFDGDESSNGLGATLRYLRIGDNATDNGGDSFGVIADDFGKIKMDGESFGPADLPLTDGDAWIMMV